MFKHRNTSQTEEMIKWSPFITDISSILLYVWSQECFRTLSTVTLYVNDQRCRGSSLLGPCFVSSAKHQTAFTMCTTIVVWLAQPLNALSFLTQSVFDYLHNAATLLVCVKIGDCLCVVLSLKTHILFMTSIVGVLWKLNEWTITEAVLKVYL